MILVDFHLFSHKDDYNSSYQFAPVHLVHAQFRETPAYFPRLSVVKRACFWYNGSLSDFDIYGTISGGHNDE